LEEKTDIFCKRAKMKRDFSVLNTQEKNIYIKTSMTRIANIENN
jgi:hypothetical protein